jgi:hypothetical protein
MKNPAADAEDNDGVRPPTRFDRQVRTDRRQSAAYATATAAAKWVTTLVALLLLQGCDIIGLPGP